MKKLLLLLLVGIFMVGCSSNKPEKPYPVYSLDLTIDVTYMNGDEDVITFVCDSMFKQEVKVILEEGDLGVRYYPYYDGYEPGSFIIFLDNKILTSGVRKYTVVKSEVKLEN